MIGPMRIAIGSDHAGFALKAHLVSHLRQAGHEVLDAGTDDDSSVDYPAYCAAVARAVASGAVDRGIVMGGSGQGEQMAANTVRGVRAALCNDLFTARMSRLHNDANVLSLGGRIVGTGLADEIVDTWLATDFAGDRHTHRIEQLAEIASLAADPGAQEALIDRLAPGALARARGEE
jgi:ribose 5-phosphate isomerase B